MWFLIALALVILTAIISVIAKAYNDIANNRTALLKRDKEQEIAERTLILNELREEKRSCSSDLNLLCKWSRWSPLSLLDKTLSFELSWIGTTEEELRNLVDRSAARHEAQCALARLRSIDKNYWENDISTLAYSAKRLGVGLDYFGTSKEELDDLVKQIKGKLAKADIVQLNKTLFEVAKIHEKLQKNIADSGAKIEDFGIDKKVTKVVGEIHTIVGEIITKEPDYFTRSRLFD